MPKANINDRSSFEQIYPKSAFDHDAGRNSRGETAMVYGLKIMSEPDADGTVEIVPMTQHTGESTPDSDSIFVAAYRAGTAATADGAPYDNSLEPTAENVDDGADYERFISAVVERARAADFKPAIGKGEERLQGFRGG